MLYSRRCKLLVPAIAAVGHRAAIAKTESESAGGSEVGQDGDDGEESPLNLTGNVFYAFPRSWFPNHEPNFERLKETGRVFYAVPKDLLPGKPEKFHPLEETGRVFYAIPKEVLPRNFTGKHLKESDPLPVSGRVFYCVPRDLLPDGPDSDSDSKLLEGGLSPTIDDGEDDEEDSAPEPEPVAEVAAEVVTAVVPAVDRKSLNSRLAELRVSEKTLVAQFGNANQQVKDVVKEKASVKMQLRQL